MTTLKELKEVTKNGGVLRAALVHTTEKITYASKDGVTEFVNAGVCDNTGSATLLVYKKDMIDTIISFYHFRNDCHKIYVIKACRK